MRFHLRPWRDGPWMEEQDRECWVDENTGLQCLVYRHPATGHLCGYVGLAPGHPYYEAASLPDVQVHGGITYTGSALGVWGVWGVRAADLYWVGFDANQVGDLSPNDPDPLLGEVYRPFWYVRAEVEALALQLGGPRRVGTAPPPATLAPVKAQVWRDPVGNPPRDDRAVLVSAGPQVWVGYLDTTDRRWRWSSGLPIADQVAGWMPLPSPAPPVPEPHGARRG